MLASYKKVLSASETYAILEQSGADKINRQMKNGNYGCLLALISSFWFTQENVV